MAKKWEKYLTKEQYWSLTYPGRVMADYWTEWLPKTCKKMHEEGTLYRHLKAEGENLLEWQVDMMHQGMAEDGAWEVIKEQIFSLPPER